MNYAPSLLFWLPLSVEDGLYQLGDPDRAAPVIVTVNNRFNVNTLREHLRGHDVYLLALDCKGVDIYTAVVSGRFNAAAIQDALLESRLAEKVDHRDLILPAWCVSESLQQEVKDTSDWECRFAPTSISDLPRYLNGYENLGTHSGEFPLEQRLHVALGSAVLFSLAMAAPAWYSGSANWWYWLLLPWVAYIVAALFYDRLPSPTSLGKGVSLGLFGSLVIAGIYAIRPDITVDMLMRGVTIIMLMGTWVGWSVRHPSEPARWRGLLLIWAVVLGAYYVAERWG